MSTWNIAQDLGLDERVVLAVVFIELLHSLVHREQTILMHRVHGYDQVINLRKVTSYYNSHRGGKIKPVLRAWPASGYLKLF